MCVTKGAAHPPMRPMGVWNHVTRVLDLVKGTYKPNACDFGLPTLSPWAEKSRNRLLRRVTRGATFHFAILLKTMTPNKYSRPTPVHIWRPQSAPARPRRPSGLRRQPQTPPRSRSYLWRSSNHKKSEHVHRLETKLKNNIRNTTNAKKTTDRK